MPKKAVLIAWGEPSRAAKGQNRSGPYEKWYYYQHTPRSPGSFYGGVGNYGYDYYAVAIQSRSSFESELEAQVEFKNNRVASWENSRNSIR